MSSYPNWQYMNPAAAAQDKTMSYSYMPYYSAQTSSSSYPLSSGGERDHYARHQNMPHPANGSANGNGNGIPPTSYSQQLPSVHHIYHSMQPNKSNQTLPSLASALSDPSLTSFASPPPTPPAHIPQQILPPISALDPHYDHRRKSHPGLSIDRDRHPPITPAADEIKEYHPIKKENGIAPTSPQPASRRRKSSSANSNTVVTCPTCQKTYKHPNCLVKHKWEHTEHWNYITNLSNGTISKHQLVQVLEAASILVGFQSGGKNDVGVELQEGEIEEFDREVGGR